MLEVLAVLEPVQPRIWKQSQCPLRLTWETHRVAASPSDHERMFHGVRRCILLRFSASKLAQKLVEGGKDERLSSNRNHLKIFGLIAGRAISGAIMLGPQLLEVAAQSGLPCSVKRGECPIRGAVVGAKVLYHFGWGEGIAERILSFGQV